MKKLDIKMLGNFSLQSEQNIISDNDNRTKKNWCLLAYLICHRERVVSQRELIKLLWGDEPASSNPENALRITFHRVRTQLDQLWPNAGRELILFKENGYFFNPEIPVHLDCDLFHELSQPKATDDMTRLASYQKAISLYCGDFLEKQSAEPWVIPISTHFHNLYICAVLEASALLAASGNHSEIIPLCRAAIGKEPYHEPLHQALIRALAATGNPKAAAAVYEELAKKLFDDFGIRPSEETKNLYRTSVHALSNQSLPMDTVLEDLQEQNVLPGALQCDYDYFKVFCHAESRAIERSGKATHIVLISVADGLSKPLSKRSLERIMSNLGEQIRLNLRRGDIFSQCSISQYIFMLPESNYENSCMVCRRVIGAFTRKYPHVTAKINYMVQPLTTNMPIPR